MNRFDSVEIGKGGEIAGQGIGQDCL